MNSTDESPPHNAPPAYKCSYCGKQALFACSVCGPATSYCSQVCQLQHWPTHQPTCQSHPPPYPSSSSIHHHTTAAPPEAPPNPMNRPQMRIPESTVARLNDLGFDTDQASDLVFYTRQVYKLLAPIMVCIVLSIAWTKISLLSIFKPQTSPLAVFNEADAGSEAEKFTGGLLNAGIILIQIAVMTVLMVLLFKYNCMRVIYSIFGFVIMSILGFTGMLLCLSIIDVTGIVIDYITLSFALFNFAVVGIVSIFWRAPRWVQQVYLILMSSLMAFALTGLQEWTTWILLAMLVLWDLFAVLSPYGPLKHLLNTVKEKNQNIEMLVYSVGGIVWLMSTIAPTRTSIPPSVSIELTSPIPSVKSTENLVVPDEEEENDDDSSGLKLGLGDFVFYSVLAARAAISDWITTITCIVAVTTGMTLTIFLLAIFRKALPALPISITFGILFYLVSALTLRELVTAAAMTRLYI